MSSWRHFASILFALTVSLAATAAATVINSVAISYTSSQITITGAGFVVNGSAPTVTFNGVGVALVSFSHTQIVASLPTSTSPGTYRLDVVNAAGGAFEMDVTYGAIGPQGPIGPLGAA